MISSLRRSDASARAAVARSCAFSLVTASCSAADRIASVAAAAVAPRLARGRDELQQREGHERRQRADDRGQARGATYALGVVHSSPRYQSRIAGPTVAAAAAPSARNVPNGSAYFIVPRLATISARPTIEPADRRQHQRHQRELPAEERADHREHLHVAHAEPFFVPHAVVGLRDRAEHAAADRMPISDDSQPGSVNRLNAKPTTMPGSVMTFGSR